MPIDVVMPQMGESITEGTVVRWIKKVGDKVDRDEPLFEISTDKVDAEIPSPAAGVLTEIRVKEGETVSVNGVVAVIGQAGDGGGSAGDDPGAGFPNAAQQPERPATTSGERSGPATGSGEGSRLRQSPLVRKLAKEHQVDLSQIHGTGMAGRVTKSDILGYLGAGGRAPAERAQTESAAFGASGQVVPMPMMRRKIAERMIVSQRTSAHVHTVFDVGFSRIDEIRELKKAEYERAGVRLTYLSFIIKAAADALRNMPVVNASVDGDTIVYHRDVNVGVAVALDWGLIVPVVRNADQQPLLGLSRVVADLASRARSKQLKPDEVTSGTFTVTNPGALGALFGTPIINQPQVAILGVGHVEKRPVVVPGDQIASRRMAYLTLGYDHRIIDGAVADQFMSRVKKTLENWDPAAA